MDENGGPQTVELFDQGLGSQDEHAIQSMRIRQVAQRRRIVGIGQHARLGRGQGRQHVDWGFTGP